MTVPASLTAEELDNIEHACFPRARGRFDTATISVVNLRRLLAMARASLAQPSAAGVVVPRKADTESMAICAIRYTIGRQSYIVPAGYAWALEWGAKSEWVRRTICDDLKSAIAKCDRGPVCQWLGSKTDEDGWREVYAKLEALSASPGAAAKKEEA